MAAGRNFAGFFVIIPEFLLERGQTIVDGVTMRVRGIKDMSRDSDLSYGVVEKADLIVCGDCDCEADVTPFELFEFVNCPNCDAEVKIPGTLGEYLIFDVLGAGGMGAVFDAYDESLNRRVAIKVLKSGRLDDPDSFSSFKFEAQAIARLNHANIVQIYSFFEQNGSPCIVMENIGGGTLFDMMRERGPLDPGMVMAAAIDIAHALEAASEISIVHGDVKPQNILFDSQMTAKLVDFGLASVEGEGQQEGIWGTPFYIAPEVITTKKSDFRSDIYSLGATLYHAIAGEPPFNGPTPKETALMRIDARPPMLGRFNRSVSSRVEDIIDRMMDPSPGMRYPTYKSLMGDLSKVATGASKSLKNVSIPKRRKSATQHVSSPVTRRERSSADESSSRHKRKRRGQKQRRR